MTFPQILERKDSEQFLVMDPFFLEFLCCGKCTVRIDPCDCFLLSEEQISLDENPEIRNSFVAVPSSRQLILSHFLSSTSCWASPQHVGNSHFCPVCILFLRCSSDTREDACNNTTDWCNFSIDMGFYSFCQPTFSSFFDRWFGFVLSVFGCLRTCCRRRRLSFLSLIASVSRRGIMTETAEVLLGAWSICFPLKTFSHFPLNLF